MRKLLLVLLLCLLPLSAAQADTLTVDLSAEGTPMSQTLYGLFYEDINHAADGGLYAELLQNRSFEYRTILNPSDSQAFTGWTFNHRSAAKGQATPSFNTSLHENNATYIRLDIQEGPYRVLNAGYPASQLKGGIPISDGAQYRFFIYLRDQGFDGTVTACLSDKQGNPLSEVFAIDPQAAWTRHETVLTATVTDDVYLCLTFGGAGGLDIDMASLMPADAYGADWQSGGLRADLVETLRDLSPRFIRFPGGCIAEGSHYHSNFYNWKDTIGPIEQRKENANTWGYMQSYGLGFHEYFQLCEDFGAEPVPVVHAGLLCQAREAFDMPLSGADLDAYIQDVLDLIEYATGGADTEWGAKRAANGHPEPFVLHYLAIGNENWSDTYFIRYGKIAAAVKAAYPDITCIVAAGPVAEGALIEDSWRSIRQRFPLDLVDEHYYMDSEWFLNNTTRYDSYPRGGNPVFLGEYAAHEPAVSGKRPNNLYSALCEAAYLTGIERNSDLVVMSCYAPLLAREGMQQWTPDLIWFNSREVLRTPNYYVQQMFAQTLGERVLPTQGETGERLYHVATRTDDTLHIKLVNVTDSAVTLPVSLAGLPDITAHYTQLSGQPRDVNGFSNPAAVAPVTGETAIADETLQAALPAWSLTIYTIPLL